MKLPREYAWLNEIEAPRIIREALALYGTVEAAGAKDNPTILAWAEEANVRGYSDDSVPWCGLFAAVIVIRAKFATVVSPLWARNWAKFGTAASIPSLGDVLVFARGAGGHVGFYVAEDKDAFHVLGGNQSDAVNIMRISKDRLLAARRPIWRVKQPDSVKPYRAAASGTLSTNEA